MRAGAKPRRAPAAKGGQWGERGARGLPGRHRSARPGVLTAAAARRDPAAVPGAAAKGAPWRGGWGATLLLSPLTGRLSEEAGGVVLLCCCCLCILWQGLLRVGGNGTEIAEEWGFCPRKCRWDTGSGPRAESTFYDESPGLGGTKWVPW